MGVNGATEAPKQDKNDHPDGDVAAAKVFNDKLPAQTLPASTGNNRPTDVRAADENVPFAEIDWDNGIAKETADIATVNDNSIYDIVNRRFEFLQSDISDQERQSAQDWKSYLGPRRPGVASCIG